MPAKSIFHVGLSERRKKQKSGEAIYAADVLTVRRGVYTPTKCPHTLCTSPAAEACLMCQKLTNLLSLRSFLGNMCAGILPQLRQGLARSAVGTGRLWETEALSLSLPSPTLSLILTRSCSSSCLPPLYFSPCYCNSSSSHFSPYFL